MNRPSRSDKGADMTRDRRVRMLTQTKGQTDMNFKKTLLAAALTLSAGFAMAADLPQVAILATGGTIAGTAASATQTTGYKAGDLAIQTLIDAVPQIKDYATVTGEQIVKISSNNLTDQVLLTLARRCNELLADPKVSGIVITHGTDTLEETAFFLNLTVKSKKPVVVIGAMRPATAISADGPMNLLNAVKLAADSKAQGRGVLVALNDQISSSRDVTKSNTTNVATFKSPDLGYLGYIAGGKNYFLRNPAMRHTHQSEFDVSKLDKLPRVDILYTHASDDRVLADAAIAAGAKGIVHAGSGNGSVHGQTEPALAEAVQKGIAVVLSSRTGSGVVCPNVEQYNKAGFIEGRTLNPQKARLLLQLALTKTNDPKEIARMFEEY